MTKLLNRFCIGVIAFGLALPLVALPIDDSVREDIKEQYRNDFRIDADDVSVKVTDGQVKLAGTVPDYYALQAADRIAWQTPGTAYVINDLRVSYYGEAGLLEDTEIRNAVERSLDWTASVDASDIDVTVENGTVRLSGNTDTYWEKTRAEETAARTDGVLFVENRIAVVPTEQRSDELIAEDVIAAIERDSAVRAEYVTVSVQDGIVELSGTVADWEARYAAARAARNTLGVTGVNNLLRQTTGTQ